LEIFTEKMFGKSFLEVLISIMCDKTCYSQKEAGELVHNHFKRKRNGRKKFNWKSKLPVRYYFCKECNAYHLTHLDYYRDWYKEEK
jgi:hypothetical protein